MFKSLISPQHLHQLIHESGDLVLLDCRFRLTEPLAGQQAYHEGHIEGAIYASLNDDLAAPASTLKEMFRGRHPLPQRRALSSRFGQWGIRKTSQIIAYDDTEGVFAARLWWLARWLGHENVAVLDGQLQAWTRHKFLLSTSVRSIATCTFNAGQPLEREVDMDIVATSVGAADRFLVDARSPDRFSGKNEVLDKRAGHIPSAINLPTKAISKRMAPSRESRS